MGEDARNSIFLWVGVIAVVAIVALKPLAGVAVPSWLLPASLAVIALDLAWHLASRLRKRLAIKRNRGRE